MERSTARALVIAAICVVAVAIVAAAIAEPTLVATGVGQEAPGEGGLFGPIEPVDHPADDLVPAWLTTVLWVVIALLLVVGLYGLVRHWREHLPTAIGLVIVIGAVVALLAFVLARIDLDDGVGLDGAQGAVEFAFGDGELGDGGATTIALLLAATLVAALLVGLVLLGLGRREVESPEPLDRPEEDDAALREALGRIAGETADRLERGDGLDNDVYRAWREMTDLLAVETPESKTAGEFARAAVDAGMQRGDVGELTRVFEEVRYGTAPATPGRERRARRVFRRIEARYAPGDG